MANIFLTNASRGSDVTMFVDVFYRLLLTRQYVSYADVIYQTDSNVPFNYFENHKISSYELYSPLKKAVASVYKELNTRCPGSVVDNGKAKGKSYKYVGQKDDPLAEDRNHYRQQTVEDYVRFCRSSIGLLPPGWFSSFFEESNFLLETRRDAETNGVAVGALHDTTLKNIRLLPILYKAISNKTVIGFDYQPFDKEKTSVVLHPQYLKEFNGRWFVLGQVADGTQAVKSFPIDRITSDVKKLENETYIKAPTGFYGEYFKNIIGVRHTKSQKAFDIVIRTHSAYYHGLVVTKPFHHSQIELSPFGSHDDGEYGEVMIHIEPTVEFVGKVLSLGSDIEVVSPAGVRHQVIEAISKFNARYAKIDK